MDSKQILQDLSANGISIHRNFIEKNKIETLISSFKKQLKNKNNVWCDDEESDSRIFGIDILDSLFSETFDQTILNNIYSKYISSTNKFSFVMANRLEFKQNNKGSGGGWHRDTFFSKQLKFILYLSDVNHDNGPFEYLPKSHFKSHKIKDLILRFKQNNIRRYANENFKNVMQITGKAGDLIIVDTSGIHRGSPIKNGKRIALTNYLNHKPFSKGVIDQLANKL
ncbi:phytanoyl-CoA dioxygenase family protein [Polaribacter sp.]|nr:phytanoyl-CoA dioxygenase family protein [Polaribacter sp.]